MIRCKMITGSALKAVLLERSSRAKGCVQVVAMPNGIGCSFVLDSSSVVAVPDGCFASCNRYVDAEDVSSIFDEAEDVTGVFSIFN